ncbi:hypothetical protein D3C78_1398810 [compost metagenome]
MGRQAAVETREECRVVRLGIGRLLGVIRVVEADANDLPRFTHQRQVVLFTNFNHGPLGVRTVGGQIHATLKQGFQRLFAQHFDALGGAYTQYRAALMVEVNVSHGVNLLLWLFGLERPP